MRAAKAAGDPVVVSLFVNPTQFGPNEDFQKYPRDMDRDAALAESTGADVLFAPSVEEVYPHKQGTSIHVPVVTELWEGAIRPGHFDGVATVVAKLFLIVRPKVAYFGRKDLQQCQVVLRMVKDLNIGVDLSFVPTMREADGLAMSSRNIYLSPEERSRAPEIHHQLFRCQRILQTKDLSESEIDLLLGESRKALEDRGFVVDYFECVDLNELKPLRQPLPPTKERNEVALIVAARLGKTRLIDNLIL